MQRVTISLDDELLDAIDRLGARRGYASRSEALRDIFREAVAKAALEAEGDTACVAALTYVYEHDKRDLARRLTSEQHDHHDIAVSTLHVHLDDRDCLEIAVLNGAVDEVRAFADSIVTQRGVRAGNLHIIPMGGKKHRHD
jgi:CopG family nickel-responsive transcriptional regulator